MITETIKKAFEYADEVARSTIECSCVMDTTHFVTWYDLSQVDSASEEYVAEALQYLDARIMDGAPELGYEIERISNLIRFVDKSDTE